MVLNKLIKMFHIVLIAVCYWLIILALGKMNLNSPISAILLLPVYALLYLAIAHGKIAKGSSSLWLVLQGISAICMLMITRKLEVDLSWDWGRLLQSSYEFAATGQLDYPEYFMQYPNNQSWLVFLIFFCKLILKIFPDAEFYMYKTVTMIAATLLVQIAIFYVYRTAKLLWDEQKAFMVGIVALLYVPFYSYAQFLYTDTPGLCIATLLMYCCVAMEKKNTKKAKWKYSAAIGILAALAYHVKIIVFIVFIAIIIEKAVKNFPKVAIILAFGGVIALAFAATHVTITKTVQMTLNFDEEEARQYEFPPSQWIMMMLNSYGGYVQEDVNFTRSIVGYEEKDAANIEVIKERLHDRGVAGTMRHILYTKQLRTWTNSCLAGDDYTHRTPIYPESIFQKIFSQDGSWHGICLIYTWIVHISILLGILLSAISALHKNFKEQQMLFGRIAIFGLWLFLSIWECNSRYLFTLASVMLLTAADGLIEGYKRCDLLTDRFKAVEGQRNI